MAWGGAHSQVVYGGQKPMIQLQGLAAGVDVLVATPGRLQEYVDRGLVSLRQVAVRRDARLNSLNTHQARVLNGMGGSTPLDLQCARLAPTCDRLPRSVSSLQRTLGHRCALRSAEMRCLRLIH